jgi:hypothetical protein
MATDSTGTTLLDKCELNTEGYPINGSGAVFIPHINKKYKIALFRNAADADANDLASAAWPTVDNLNPVVSGVIGTDFDQIPLNADITNKLAGVVQTFDDVADMISGTLVSNDSADFSHLAENRAIVATRCFRSFAPVKEPKGAAKYIILSAAEYGSTPDGEIVGGNLFGGDHYVGGGTSYVAVLFRETTPTVTQYGAFGNLGYDDYPAIQKAISNNNSVRFPDHNYLVKTSLNVTDRFQGITLIADHSGIANGGAVLVGETGEKAILDFSGSQKIIISGLSLKSGVAGALSERSKLGMLFSRSTTGQYSQFNEIRSLRVDIASDPTAFGGAGTLGVMIKAGEICNIDSLYSLADTGMAIVDTDTRWNITSDYKTLTGVPTSNSTYKISGNTVLDSRNEVGVPLYCKAVVNLEGMCYVNGVAGVGDTYGMEVEGINKGWDFTIFPEFANKHALMPCTFQGSKLSVMGAMGATFNIDTTAAFTAWTDCEILFVHTLSGAFTSPDYWIDGASGDVMTNVRISAPAEPAVRWVRPTNAVTNLKGGYDYTSPTKSQLSKNQLSTPSAAWDDEPFTLGAYRLWVDSTGDLRIKSGAPGFDTDGVVVGSQ